jgi:hypothetical protein
MIRKLLLAVVSLAIFIALYFLYNMFFSIPVEKKPVSEQEAAPVIRTTTLPASGVVNMANPKAAVMTGEGEEAFFERWVKGRLVYQFRSEHWKPTDPNKPGTYDLEKPELRLFLRGGQLMHVSADEGQIVTSENTSKAEPKRGELRGNIHIYLDRGTDPDRGPAELRPGDVVHIWLNKIRFDLENNRIDTDDPISIEAEEATLSGEGLTITWNDATNLIEEITVRKGKKLILYRGADMLGIQVPGSAKLDQSSAASPADQPAAMNALAKTSAGREVGSRFMASPLTVEKSRFKTSETDETATDPTATTSPASQPTTKPRSSKSYKITFSSDVKVNQFDSEVLMGKMICDRLNVIFDLPKSSESQTMTAGSASEKKPGQKREQTNTQRLEITWQGPLTIRPESMPYSPERRFHILASGQNVRIEQKDQGTVRCKKLTYFEEAKQIWLDGTIEEPVNISQGVDRTIVAAHLFFDRKKGIATGTGPGFMQERAGDEKKPKAQNDLMALGSLQSGGQKMKVLWSESFKLNFGELPGSDENDEAKPYIKYAEFRGQARMEGSGTLMKGDVLVLDFLTPDSGEKTSGKIKTLHAEQNVMLKSDQQVITCEQLDVSFTDGKTPRLALAKGNVRASENKRLIVADELRALMETEKAPTDSQPAGDQTPMRKSKRDKVVIREVDARGNVAIRDPDESLRVDCQKLQARFDADRTIRRCYLEGTEKDWATANLPNDYYIAGPKITLDLTTEKIDIPGPGKLRFANSQDIEGTKRDKVYINIDWKESMKMTGGQVNQGTFLGQATVKSDYTTLNADKLIVDFENAPAEVKAVEKKTGWDLSRFMSLVRTGKKSEEIKLPVTRKRPTYLRAFPEEGKPITIQHAKREKDALLNRTTLWGSTLDIDLVSNKINIPGAGVFLVEDFQKLGRPAATQASAGKTNSQDPFGAEMKSDNPSLTKFTWKNGLTYLMDSKTAIFDGSVNMLHLAGSDIYDPATGTFELKDRKPERETTLTCDNLKVEFLKGAFGLTDSTPGRSLDLSSVVASGSVHLQDSPRSVIAPQLTYNRKEKLIVIRGSEASPAYLYEEKRQTGQYMMWEGPLIIWNQATDEIQAPGAAITTTLQ